MPDFVRLALALALASQIPGCGPKDDATGGTVTETTAPSTSASSTTAPVPTTIVTTTTGPTETGPSDPSDGPMCEDRSIFCMPAIGGGGGETSAGETAGGESSAGDTDQLGCDDLLTELESGAQTQCSAGFSGIGLLDISELVSTVTMCCYVFHCQDPTTVCIPLAGLDKCESMEDLSDAGAAPYNACSSAIGSDIDPSPVGDLCCAQYQCVCGDTGG
jgi:hypothetical protein